MAFSLRNKSKSDFLLEILLCLVCVVVVIIIFIVIVVIIFVHANDLGLFILIKHRTKQDVISSRGFWVVMPCSVVVEYQRFTLKILTA